MIYIIGIKYNPGHRVKKVKIHHAQFKKTIKKKDHDVVNTGAFLSLS